MATQLVILMETLATQNNAEDLAKHLSRLEAGDKIVDFLILNTLRRCMFHSGLKRERCALYVHKQLYDQTYFDVRTDKERDLKVNAFFEPLVVIFDNDKKAMIASIKRQLDRYIPIPPGLNMEWNPVMVSVPYVSRDKNDTRTKRLTLRFDWSKKKAS